MLTGRGCGRLGEDVCHSVGVRAVIYQEGPDRRSPNSSAVDRFTGVTQGCTCKHACVHTHTHTLSVYSLCVCVQGMCIMFN